MFFNILLSCLNILLWGAISLLGIILIIETFDILVNKPYRNISSRLSNDTIFDGLIGFLTIIPKFLAAVNLIYYCVFVFHILYTYIPFVKRFFTGDISYTFAYTDYLLALLIFASIFITTELLRLLEYKLCFNTTSDITVSTYDFKIDKGHLIYNSCRVDIKEVNGEKVIFLKKEPTLHGKDSIHGNNVEYIIKGIDIDREGYKLSLKPVNTINYNFYQTQMDMISRIKKVFE